MKLFICCCLIMLAVTGCTNPKTTIILLPEENNAIGKAVVTAPKGSMELHEAYSSTTVTNHAKVPEEINYLSAEEVAKRYPKLFEAEPQRPITIILYFEFDKDLLTTGSTALIPEVIGVVARRQPAEVSIIGHADRKGSDEYNYKLALERAEKVHQILLKSGLDIKNLEVISHGKNDPLVPTADNVAEPRNRRVEIMVR